MEAVTTAASIVISASRWRCSRNPTSGTFILRWGRRMGSPGRCCSGNNSSTLRKRTDKMFSTTIVSSSKTELVNFRIISINDVYDLTNLPKLQTYLSKLPADKKPQAVTLCGDFLSPSTLSSIDGGRGMVSTLRTVGISHVSFGNHEQDLKLPTLHQRIIELSKSIEVLNSNVLPSQEDNAAGDGNKNEWIRSLTHRYSIVPSSCGRVKVALIGLLSDEPGLFRDNTFKSIPIHDVLETYTDIYNDLITRTTAPTSDEHDDAADFIVPMTHSSMNRDKELAQHILQSVTADDTKDGPDHVGYVILGGHEHEPYDEIVSTTSHKTYTDIDGATIAEDDGPYVRILKSGMDAQNAIVLDLTFEVSEVTGDAHTQAGAVRPRLVQIESELVNLTKYESSSIAQEVVDKHMSVITALENEIIVDVDEATHTTTRRLPPGKLLSSEGTRFQQTTVGGIFCQMMKEELEVDVAMINGAVLKGDMTYYSGQITYAQLKAELPFPTKMVVIPMKTYELQEAIHYSRTAREEGTDPDAPDSAIPRRGFLQVDDDYDQSNHVGGLGPVVFSSVDDDLIIKVALPRNLLGGFCRIKPLMEIGTKLMEDGLFPGDDDYVPAIDLIVRHACKNRWSRLVQGSGPRSFFQRWDLNGDGVLEFDEIREMLTHVLGHTPPDFVIQDMIDSIDEDKNGVIDEREMRHLIAQMERERFWKS